MATMSAPSKLTQMNAPAKPEQIRLTRRSPAYWPVSYTHLDVYKRQVFSPVPLVSVVA